MDEFEQLVVVGQSLIEEQACYQRRNAELFQTISSNYSQVATIRGQHMNRVKQQLQALLNKKEEIAQKSGQTGEVGETERQEQQLRQEYSVVRQNQEELSAQCQQMATQRLQLEQEVDRLQAEKERLQNETTIMLPMKREELQLYSSISYIRWDFEGSKDEIKGYISNKSEVVPFCFDKRKCSQFFITNSLWDSMKED